MKGLHAISSYKDQVLNLPKLRTISTGFRKIKDQKMEIVFIIKSKFTIYYLSYTQNY